MSLINVLIILMLLLLISQIYNYLTQIKTVEGMESNGYSNYNTNNPDNALILAQQNAGNISYLKEQVDELSKMNTTVNELKEENKLLNTQIQDIVEQQSKFAEEMAGNTPPEVTGAD